MRLWSILVLIPAVWLGGCRSDDRELEKRVNEELATIPDGQGVMVSVDNRVVTLRGVAESEADKTRLEGVVEHLPGVLAVKNDLVVQGPVSTTGATSAIADAERALAASIDAQLESAGFPQLDVTIEHGRVRITGAVALGRHDEALDIARRAATAYRVDDETIVTMVE